MILLKKEIQFYVNHVQAVRRNKDWYICAIINSEKSMHLLLRSILYLGDLVCSYFLLCIFTNSIWQITRAVYLIASKDAAVYFLADLIEAIRFSAMCNLSCVVYFIDRVTFALSS